MMKNNTRLTALALATILAGACSGVMDSKQPARQYYLLTPDTTSSGTGNPTEGPALSMTVSVVPGLDTDRVLALSPDARLSPYANARWPDHLPEVITSVLKRSLAASGSFSSVEDSTRLSDDGWLLTLEIQQFYGIQNGAGNTSSVRVEMAGAIQCNGRLAPVRLSDSNTVAEERLATVVAAHQQGLNDVTQQLLQQIHGACS